VYNGEYGLEKPTLADELIGPVLFKDEESTANYNSLEILMSNYIKYEIKNHMGITLIEFLNLPKYVREIYIATAEKIIDARNEAANSINDDMNNKLENFEEGFNFEE